MPAHLNETTPIQLKAFSGWLTGNERSRLVILDVCGAKMNDRL